MINTNRCRQYLFLLSISTYVLFSHISVLATNYTYSVPETTKQALRVKGRYSKDCPVRLERLAVVRFLYYDFNGNLHKDGEIIVLDSVAEHVYNIFKSLADIKFPIDNAKIVSPNLNGDYNETKNNTSSFNCRLVVGNPSFVSLHSYGLAIDVNPIQNPYINPIATLSWGIAAIEPPEGGYYLNRGNQRQGMVESVIDIFKENGFPIWGGTWNDPVDYMHFQTSRSLAILLAKMDKDNGKEFFKLYAKKPYLLNHWDPKDYRLVKLYQKNPTKFIKAFTTHIDLMDMKSSQAIEKINNLLI